MSNNPWTDIKIPPRDYNARVANSEHPCTFYWAKDVHGNHLFILHSSKNLIVPARIPRPKGIDITVGHLADTGKDQLVLTLLEKENTDIFHSLCKDLMNATKNETDERSAVSIIIRRLERWQYFLQRANNKIDEKTLRGLLGELWFMKNHLMASYSPAESLDFWSGPLGDVHDFGIGNTSVEIKTKSSTQKATVTISSPDQLYCNLKHLYLFVLTVSKSSRNDTNTITISDLVEQIKKKLSDDDPQLCEKFDNLLMEYGYMDLDEYKELFFVTDNGSVYEVEESFPKLSRNNIPDGIENIRFELNLVKCQSYLKSTDDFTDIIRNNP